MKKVFSSLLLLAVLVGGVIYGTTAFFSDTETAIANTFTAGGLDLQIDSTAHYNGMICVGDVWIPEEFVTEGEVQDFDQNQYNIEHPIQYPKAGDSCSGSWKFTNLSQEKFFNLADIKPGDTGENTISLHVDNNDAWACMELSNVQNFENEINEPESLVDDTPEGELGDKVMAFSWRDNGDNIFEVGEEPIFGPQSINASFNQVYTLADSGTGAPLPGSDDLQVASYVGLQWCAGTMSVNLDTGEISCLVSGMGNETQTDGLTADISFNIEQARNNPNFECVTCQTTGEGWASSVIASAQAKRKDGSSVLASRSNTSSVLGSADGGSPAIEGNFYSLGFGGSITVGFADKVYDIDGDDLSFHEVTNGRSSYPEEKAKVEVAQNSSGPWVEIGIVNSLGSAVDYLDIAGNFPWVKYVRITDISDSSIHSSTADGYDVDAVDAVEMCINSED